MLDVNGVAFTVAINVAAAFLLQQHGMIMRSQYVVIIRLGVIFTTAVNIAPA